MVAVSTENDTFRCKKSSSGHENSGSNRGLGGKKDWSRRSFGVQRPQDEAEGMAVLHSPLPTNVHVKLARSTVPWSIPKQNTVDTDLVEDRYSHGAGRQLGL